MKYSECNAKQKKAWRNIKYAAIDYIFGLENGCNDSEVGSPEYNAYKEQLEDLNELVEVVYHEAIHNIYDEGCCFFGAGAETYLKDIRFCGKEWLMEVTTAFCKKYQKEALANI